jgi:hypothetical protein
MVVVAVDGEKRMQTTENYEKHQREMTYLCATTAWRCCGSLHRKDDDEKCKKEES